MKITAPVIAEALAIPASRVHSLVASGHFAPMDRTSNLPGRGRDWTDNDIATLAVLLRLQDVGLDPAIGQDIPRIDPPAGKHFFVADVFDIHHECGVKAPGDFRVRIVSAEELADLFQRGQSAAHVIDLDSVFEDVGRVVRLRSEVAAWA